MSLNLILRGPCDRQMLNAVPKIINELYKYDYENISTAKRNKITFCHNFNVKR